MPKRSYSRAFGFKDSGAGRRWVKRHKFQRRVPFLPRNLNTVSLNRGAVGAIARIARRAVGSEGKIFNNVGSQTFVNFNTRYNNIMWDLTAGTGQGNIIGEQCYIKGFRLNFEFKQIVDGNASDPVNPVNIRVMVIRWRDFKAGSFVTQWVDDSTNAAQYYRSTGDLFTSPPNTDQIERVMKDFTFIIKPYVSGQATSIFNKIWVPIDRNFRYDSSSLGEGRDYNYYVVCTAAQVDSTGGIDDCVNVTLEKTIYYRDA